MLSRLFRFLTVITVFRIALIFIESQIVQPACVTGT